MLTQRLIVCLDVRNGRVVKGTQFADLRDVGDPVELATRYEGAGADEIVFLDISASIEGRGTLLNVVRDTAARLFIPLTVGGGVRGTQDIVRVLRAGADKVCLNSAAVESPEVLTDAAALFGAQCVVVSIDVKSVNGKWVVFTHGGRVQTELDAVSWARECVMRGAGEILLTSIDRDGSRRGYDVDLTRAVSDAVDVPVIASGGAGSPADVVSVLKNGGASGALVAGMLHDGVTTVREIKASMRDAGLAVRMEQGA